MPDEPILPEADVVTFRQRICGGLVTPGDESYDRLRTPWLQVVEQRPALIVSAANVDDIAAAVTFARERRLPFGVMATGHGIAAPCDGGLLLRLSEMKGIRIDPVARIAHVEPGVNSGELLAACEPHGLAYPAGQVSNVGVVGYTLGGGIGWIARRSGAACGRVRSAVVVLADGATVKASADEHPDLFWALRGGGGSFGVIASLELALEPLGEVYGGMIWYPFYDAGRVLAFYRDWAAGLPPETSTTLRLTTLPPDPKYPETLRGKTACAIGLCHTDAATLDEVMSPLRSFRTALFDQLASQPLSGMANYDEASHVPGSPTYGHVEYLKGLSDEVIVKLIEIARTRLPPLMMFELQQLGGALASGADDTMAYTVPRAPFLLHAVSPAVKASLAALARDTKKAFATMANAFTGGACYNYLRGDEQGRVPAAFDPSKYLRLQNTKRCYDPANFFRLNLNIKP